MRNLYGFLLLCFATPYFLYSQEDTGRVYVRGGFIYNASGEIFHAPDGIVFSKGGKIENLGRISVGKKLENLNDASDDAMVHGAKSTVYFIGKKAEIKKIFQFQEVYTTLTDTLLLDNSKENEIKGRFYIEDKVVVTSDPGLNIKTYQLDGRGELYLPANDKKYSQLITTAAQSTVSDTRIEHYYPASGWYWVSSPIQPDLSQFKRGGSIIKNQSAYVYDASKGFYQPIDETYDLNPTDGTRLYFGNFNGRISFFNPTVTPLAPLKRGVVDVSGLANSGEYTYNAEYNSVPTTNVGYPPSTPDVNKLGWNLIANPYPSSLDWRKVSRGALVTEAVYTTNMKTGMISSYVDGLYTNDGSPYVTPFASFLVRVIGTDAVDLGISSRTFASDQSFKNVNLGYDAIKIKARSVVYPDVWDDLVVAFRLGATDSYDIKYDALKVFNPNKEAHNIYSGSSDRRKERDAYYAINVLQKKQQALIPMYFNASSTTTTGLSAREYEISADLSHVNPAWAVKLEDLSTGEIYDMRSLTPYLYSYTVGDTPHRFNLLINTEEEETSNKSLDNVTVWTEKNGIHIYMKSTNNNLLSEVYDVKIYNTYGSLLHEMQISPGMDYIFKPSEGLTRTIYILKITVGPTNKVHRVIY